MTPGEVCYLAGKDGASREDYLKVVARMNTGWQGDTDADRNQGVWYRRKDNQNHETP